MSRETIERILEPLYDEAWASGSQQCDHREAHEALVDYANQIVAFVAEWLEQVDKEGMGMTVGVRPWRLARRWREDMSA